MQCSRCAKQGMVEIRMKIAGEDVLVPGPSLVHGLRRIHEIIQTFQAA